MQTKFVARFGSYVTLLCLLMIISVVSRIFFANAPHVEQEVDWQLFLLGGIFFVGYIINRVAPKTIIPSFVWAIFAGMAIQPLLAGNLSDVSALKIVMEVLAALVLFAGGLEIPFKNFKKWFLPIASLSMIGVLVSAVIFAGVIVGIFFLMGVSIGPELLPSIIILSAAVASTDPTAIIPTLQILHLKRPFLKQIAVAESALTDVSGSILTRFLLIAMITATAPASGSFLSYFTPLFKKATYDAFALQIMSGIAVGYFGFYLIKKFYAKTTHSVSTDPALLITVPLFTFVLGNFLGGAGFLASFVSGLLADISGGIKQAAHFYDSLLNHLVKPFVFIVLGALVPFDILIAMAPLGIISALLFMFVARPLVVLISLAPWLASGEFTWKDLFFLSFIRETGIIAAVLIIIASSYGFIQSDFMIAIGMWVILLTLLIEPPLTPYLAKKIGIAS